MVGLRVWFLIKLIPLFCFFLKNGKGFGKTLLGGGVNETRVGLSGLETLTAFFCIGLIPPLVIYTIGFPLFLHLRYARWQVASSGLCELFVYTAVTLEDMGEEVKAWYLILYTLINKLNS